MQVELFPKQDEFVFSTTRFSGYGGGFGNGKTLSGLIKTYNHCQQAGAYFLIGRRNATDLRDSTLKDFLEFFGHTGHYRRGTQSFKFPNGSEVIFRHLDDMQSLTNMNLSGFWIDQSEEVSEEAFDFLVGRLRRPVERREGFITFNMNGHDWIWRRFKKLLDREGKPLSNAEDYSLVEASTLENKDNLPEDYVRSLMAQPDEFVKRYVYGSWDTFSGQIFDEFREHIHVIKPFQVPNTWERVRGIDHGQKNPTACLWAAIDYDGNIYIYQEYYATGIVSKHAEAISQMSRVRTTTGYLIQDHYAYTVIDPSAAAKNREKNGHLFSVADEYVDHGIPTIPAQNDVIAGINRVKEYLKIDPEHYHPLKTLDEEPVKGAPHIYIFESCVNLIEEVQQYKWKQLSSNMMGRADIDTPKERPVKRNDHAVDALRYVIMSRPVLPTHKSGIEPWVFRDPLELARRAKSLGMTVDDLLYQRHRATRIRHSDTGITHDGGIEHTDGLN